jgi:hypothetical protein
MTSEQRRILTLTDAIRAGDWWSTYTTMSLVVYGHERARQTVGSTLRDHGDNKSAHRVLAKGGKVSEGWKGTDLHGLGGGREECVARLRDEGLWEGDDRHGRARPDREIDAAGIQRLERQLDNQETPG